MRSIVRTRITRSNRFDGKQTTKTTFVFHFLRCSGAKKYEQKGEEDCVLFAENDNSAQMWVWWDQAEWHPCIACLSKERQAKEREEEKTERLSSSLQKQKRKKYYSPVTGSEQQKSNKQQTRPQSPDLIFVKMVGIVFAQTSLLELGQIPHMSSSSFNLGNNSADDQPKRMPKKGKLCLLPLGSFIGIIFCSSLPPCILRLFFRSCCSLGFLFSRCHLLLSNLPGDMFKSPPCWALVFASNHSW